MERVINKYKQAEQDLALWYHPTSEPKQREVALQSLSVIFDSLKKAAEYENAEEQGRLVVLPCQTGRTVYIVDSKKINRCITENTLVRNGLMARAIGTCVDTRYAVYPQDIGKTVFFTREEAEKALEVQNG